MKSHILLIAMIAGALAGCGPGAQGPAGPAGATGPQGPTGPLMTCGTNEILVYGAMGWTCATTLADLEYGRVASKPGVSCRDIKARVPTAADGVYLIDPDGSGPIGRLRVLCDMTRDDGGWTLILKNRYQSGMHGRADGFGSLDDLHYHQTDFYKLSDTIINAVIGDGTFDILADQAGYNSAYSSGNHEYVIVRNYTATFTFKALVPESTTTTVFESYRSADDLLVWRGRLGCGYGSGVGINCYTLLTTPSPIGATNPQGGAGCLFPLGNASNVGWHHFYMSENNTDTYLYICNGAQHSSSYDMSHRWWVR